MTSNTATTITAISVRPFDESSPRYHCCCGCVHVRTGAFLIGCLQAMGLFSLLFRSAKAAHGFRSGMDFGAGAYAPTFLSTLFFVFSIVAVVCLFHGICNEKPNYLTPMLALILFAIIYYAFLVVFFIIVFIAGSQSLIDYVRIQLEIDDGAGTKEEKDDQARRAVKVALLAMVTVFLIGIAFDFWFYKVVKACRTYLQEKKAWYAHHPNPHYAVLVTDNGGRYDGGEAGFVPSSANAYSAGQPNYNKTADGPFNVPPPPSYNEAVSPSGNGGGKFESAHAGDN